MTIQPKETRYKGYRFRSRLEARWAVFFDALGIQWEYEKEGFDLGEAGSYLPDFWLPNIYGGVYIEIKGAHIDYDDQSAHLKAHALGLQGFRVVVFRGLPEEFSNGKVCAGDSEFDVHFNTEQTRWILDSDFSDLGWFALTELPRAIAAARSARFEHGETPQF